MAKPGMTKLENNFASLKDNVDSDDVSFIFPKKKAGTKKRREKKRGCKANGKGPDCDNGLVAEQENNDHNQGYRSDSNNHDLPANGNEKIIASEGLHEQGFKNEAPAAGNKGIHHMVEIPVPANDCKPIVFGDFDDYTSFLKPLVINGKLIVINGANRIPSLKVLEEERKATIVNGDTCSTSSPKGKDEREATSLDDNEVKTSTPPEPIVNDDDHYSISSPQVSALEGIKHERMATNSPDDNESKTSTLPEQVVDDDDYYSTSSPQVEATFQDDMWFDLMPSGDHYSTSSPRVSALKGNYGFESKQHTRIRRNRGVNKLKVAIFFTALSSLLGSLFHSPLLTVVCVCAAFFCLII